MCAAYCAFSSNFDGTITSASTVHSGTLNFLRRSAAPGFRLAHRILIARPPARLSLLHRIAASCVQGKRRSTKPIFRFCQSGGNIRNAFSQKRDSAADLHWDKTEPARKKRRLACRSSIRRIDRNIERRIIDTTLRPLHPVNDARAFRVRQSPPPHRHARILRELSQIIHGRRSSRGAEIETTSPQV